MSTKSFVSVTRSLGPAGGTKPVLQTSPPSTQRCGWPRGRERISKSYVDTALTIHGRLLQIPDAERMLLEMASTLAKGGNPFNSAHRLQAIASTCGRSKENAMWVLRHMAHMVTHLAMSASSAGFSVDGLRGSP